ncbi:MAG: hypothetical protein LAO78_25895 [Acidobacteriia bacterium]|nr:hypothetical protein [Terriglobia bacterium]
MNLKEAVDQITGDPSRFPATWLEKESIVPTVFARKIEGHFHPESEATIVDMNIDEGGKQYTSQGWDYFLEVFLVRELLEEWQESSKSHKGQMTPLEALIYYAEMDAFPFEA